MNTFDSSVKNLILLPTTQGGKLKDTHWLTTLSCNLQDWAFDKTESDFIITKSGKTRIINQNIVLVSSLENANDKLLDAWEAGFPTIIQKNAAKDGTKRTVVETSTVTMNVDLMSSAQFLDYKIGEQLKPFESALELAEQLQALNIEQLSDEFTKLITKIEKVKETIKLSSDDFEFYTKKLEKEEEDKKRNEILVSAGFTKILPCIGYKKDGKSVPFIGYVGTISMMIHKDIRNSALDSAGFTSETNHMELDPMTDELVVYFTNKIEK